MLESRNRDSWRGVFQPRLVEGFWVVPRRFWLRGLFGLVVSLDEAVF